MAAAASHDRVSLFLRLPGAPPTDMYINVQCKTSWSPLGFQVANLAPSLLKPMARGRVSLTGADAAVPPCVEFNFTGHELDLKRFMQGFRRAVEVLAHEQVRAMAGVTFPVKFTDRLRRLNRITPANRVQSAVIAALIDLVPPLAGPIFSTLADCRVDLATLAADDEALAEHIRQNVAGTFHPVGTCRMGAANDRDAVVDSVTRARDVGPAGRRRLDHADRAARQHQHPHHHGGGEDLRDDGRDGTRRGEMTSQHHHRHPRPYSAGGDDPAAGQGGAALGAEARRAGRGLDRHGDRGQVVQNPMPREGWDLDLRLADMDKHGIDRQAICATVHTFYYDQEPALGAACAIIQNDEIVAVARRHSHRFVALATLPLQDPQRGRRA